MPSVDKTPPNLKPYYFHGLDLQWSEGEENAEGECPWCGSDKFSVKAENGVWQCWVCGEGNEVGGGNTQTFIRLLIEKSQQATKLEEFKEFAKSRRFPTTEILKKWGACRSVINKNWIIPAGCNSKRQFSQAYRWLELPDKGFKLLPTPGMGSFIFGHNLYSPKSEEVYICEGPWDAMILWWVLLKLKKVKKVSVLGVPGTNNFHESWLPLFYKKKVNLMFDSDHPKRRCLSCKKTCKIGTEGCPHCGSNEFHEKVIEPAGMKAVKRVAGLLLGSANPPSEITYCNWGPDGYDPKLPSGTDLRDIITGAEVCA